MSYTLQSRSVLSQMGPSNITFGSNFKLTLGSCIHLKVPLKCYIETVQVYARKLFNKSFEHCEFC